MILLNSSLASQHFHFELVRFYAGEVVSIIIYLNSQEIVNGNIKPRNIYVPSSLHLKISDFRNIKTSEANKRKVSTLLSADYISPELLDEGEAGVPADMWALGCIIYQMLVGAPPFVSATQYTTFDRIHSGVVEFQLSLPSFAVDLIQSLLLLDPQLRIWVADIKEVTTHTFFQELDIQRIFTFQASHYTTEMLPEKIIESKMIFKDIVKKKAGWLYKKRILEITTQPSIKYYEPIKFEFRGSIEILPQLKAESKNKTDFQIITPKSAYYFKIVTGTPEIF